MLMASTVLLPVLIKITLFILSFLTGRDITLTSAELVYSMPDGGARKDAIPITSTTIVKPWESADPHREFAFSTISGSDELILVGNTAEDTQAWMNDIRKCVDRKAFSEVTSLSLSNSTTTLSSEELGALCDVLLGDSTEKHALATYLLRRCLVDPANNQRVVDCGILLRMVEFLRRDACRLEAAWVLTNIASGEPEHTRSVVRCGAVQELLELLVDPAVHPEVQAQAAWALGNVCGDCEELRVFVVDAGAVDVIVQLVGRICAESDLGLRRQISWLMNGVARDAEELAPIQPLVPCFAQLLKVDTDNEVIETCCWGLAYTLTDAEPGEIQATINTGIVPRLLELTKADAQQVVQLSTRLLGVLCSGSDEQTQQVLDEGFINEIPRLLDEFPYAVALRKELCWILSNITAGTRTQLRMVFDWGLTGRLVAMLGGAEDPRVLTEVVYAVCNASANEDLEVVLCFTQEVRSSVLCYCTIYDYNM